MIRRTGPAFVALALVVPALLGCSSPAKDGAGTTGRELRTSLQAASFVVDTAGGQSSGDWRLVDGASPEAVQAWRDRAAIVDFGGRLRGSDASWACKFAHEVVGLGSVGFFNSADVPTVVKEARAAHAPSDSISAMLHDVLTMRYREVVLATVAICGPVRS